MSFTARFARVPRLAPRVRLAPATARFVSFKPGPAPPRLPPEEQAEFERLQTEAADSIAAEELADAFAAQQGAAPAAAGQADSLSKGALESKLAAAASAAASAASPAAAGRTQAAGTADAAPGPVDGVWRGAPPEFEGDRNPKTGEIGGPKNEPLRWGAQGDWSFNGRVTDF